MKLDFPFLTRTANKGWYGYRRRVPKHLLHLFKGKTEIVKAFNTKNHEIALIELAKTNHWYEDRVLTNGYTTKKSGVLPREQLKAIVSDLENTGLHPEQQPEVNVHTSRSDLVDMSKDALDAAIAKVKLDQGEIDQDEYLALLKPLEAGKMWQLQAFQTRRGFLLSHLHKKYTDHDRLIGSGPILMTEDYVPPQLKWDEADPEVIKYRIMNGDPVNPQPTWQNALDTYLRYNLKKRRNPEQTFKHKTASVSMANKLGTAFPLGMHTPLVDIEQYMIEDFAEVVWPNGSTRDRNLRTLAAVWRSWDTNNQKQQVSFDPFKAIIKQMSDKVKQDTKPRRSMTPAEFQYFNTSILEEPNTEIKLIGMIMAYCGAPTGEAAGLTRKDIKLTGVTPHMIFRNNEDRIMGKDRIERAVPLIYIGIELDVAVSAASPLLTFLLAYFDQHKFKPNDLVFPEYAAGKYVSSVRSKLLEKHIKNMRSDVDDRQLVPYSLRHTFKDRVQAAGIASEVGEYIMGHKTSGSSKVHESYGTGMPPQLMVNHMKAITVVQEHGYFEQYD